MTPPDRLRALLAQTGLIVMPAVWDGLSSKLAAEAGFPTAFLSGFCVSAARLAAPDLDLMSAAEMLGSLAMVREASPETLVLADGDHGYGNAINVQRTVRNYARAGAAAVLIEDKITPRSLNADGKACLSREDARLKIRAAVAAAKESGILVLARTDSRQSQGLDEALARIEMFSADGADILFMDGPADEDEMRRAVLAAGERPSFSVLSPLGNANVPTQARAAELGLKIGTFPTAMISPAIKAMKAALFSIGAGRSESDGDLDLVELLQTLGYSDYALAAKRLVSGADLGTR